MTRTLALAALAAALLPLAPAHAATEEYGVTPSCSIVGSVVTSYDRVQHVVAGTAVAKSTVAVPVSTTIHCELVDPRNGQVYWQGTQAAPGAVSAVAGTANAYADMVVCGWAAATFSDGTTIQTAPC
jgi:hypothetical protein